MYKSSRRLLWRKNALLAALLLTWLLPALACNLPAAPDPTVSRSVEQTVMALTAQAAQLPTPIPLPGETLVAMPPEPTREAPLWPGAGVTPPAGEVFSYTTQPGDTAAALAGRFGVPVEQIVDPARFFPQFLLPEGQALLIPDVLGSAALPYGDVLLPDSEVVYSPAARDFSTAQAVAEAGGFLSTYSEEVDGKMLSGAQIIERVALETSTNPRLLLGVLEYRSGWVFGQPRDPAATAYPIGFYANQYSGLYKEMNLVSRQFTIGYYGWRAGSLTELEFTNGSRVRIHPALNAGSVGVQYLFSKLYDPAQLAEVLYGADSFPNRYRSWYGDAWQRAAALGPLLPYGLQTPQLELPFAAGERWSFTGGPHAAWGVGSPWGGLDFSPANVEKGCGVSVYWVTASVAGQVVRAENGIVVIDLDMDGSETTGWALMYLHLAEFERIALGTQVKVNDPLGHPSCEGGFSTGTHLHLARKYNGEWLAAEGPLPFVLSGWQAWKGDKPYSGSLVKDDQIVTSRPDGAQTSIIIR